MFLDESGIDRRQSPYEVLAGVAIHDQQLWKLILDVQELEIRYFGTRISTGILELKGKKLLKTKTFRLARQVATLDSEKRTHLAGSCLTKGAHAETAHQVTQEELAGLAQAKIAFVEALFDLCYEMKVRAFASIVPKAAPRPEGNFLRKDYAYLFQRFFYLLEDTSPSEPGLVIFDELERSQCHILVDQMSLYFRETATGRQHATRVIPEPFFVHSELTTAIQLADLVAYIVCWGVRFGKMRAQSRPELGPLAQKVQRLRYRTEKSIGGIDGREIFSFTLIRDLRPRNEQELK